MKIFSLKNLRIVRWIVIILLLVLFTALFGGFRMPWRELNNAPDYQFMPGVLSVAALGMAGAFGIMILLAAITAFCGRVYCSWCCPLGLLQEVIERLDHKLFTKKVRIYKKGHNIFRAAFLVLLLALLFGGIALPFGYIEPYSLFGKISSNIIRQLLAWLNDSTVSIPQSAIEDTTAWRIALAVSGGAMLGLIALVVLKGRIFCNTVCPAGMILAALAARSGKRLAIDHNKCVKCRKCEKVCNANCINIADGQTIDFTRCFMCMECPAGCPVNAIKVVRRRKNNLTGADLPTAPERRNMLIAAGIAGVAGFAATRILKNASPYKKTAILPPGAGSEEEFLARCTGCGLCVANCRGGCLQPASDEYGWRGFMLPVMKFSGSHPGKCEYECNKCTANCPTGALKKMSLKEKKLCRIGMANFNPKQCLAYMEGEPCGACAEHCPTGALKMVPGPHDNATIPQVTGELCIGCGNCQYACPVTPQAIIVKAVSNQSKAVAPDVYYKKEEVKKAPSSIPF